MLSRKLDCFQKISLCLDTKIHSCYDNYHLNTPCFLMEFDFYLYVLWSFANRLSLDIPKLMPQELENYFIYFLQKRRIWKVKIKSSQTTGEKNCDESRKLSNHHHLLNLPQQNLHWHTLSPHANRKNQNLLLLY